MLRKLLKVFLWFIFVASLSFSLIEFYGAISIHWKMRRCIDSMVSFNIEPSQKKTYEAAIPSYSSTHAIFSILDDMDNGSKELTAPEMKCELMIQNKLGKVLFHEYGYYSKEGVIGGNNIAFLFIRLKENPASGKIIFKINEVAKGSFKSKLKVFFTPYIYSGIDSFGYAKLIGKITLMISIVTGIFLYMMIKSDKLKEKE